MMPAAQEDAKSTELRHVGASSFRHVLYQSRGLLTEMTNGADLAGQTVWPQRRLLEGTPACFTSADDVSLTLRSASHTAVRTAGTVFVGKNQHLQHLLAQVGGSWIRRIQTDHQASREHGHQDATSDGLPPRLKTVGSFHLQSRASTSSARCSRFPESSPPWPAKMPGTNDLDGSLPVKKGRHSWKSTTDKTIFNVQGRCFNTPEQSVMHISHFSKLYLYAESDPFSGCCG